MQSGHDGKDQPRKTSPAAKVNCTWRILRHEREQAQTVTYMPLIDSVDVKGRNEVNSLIPLLE